MGDDPNTVLARHREVWRKRAHALAWHAFYVGAIAGYLLRWALS